MIEHLPLLQVQSDLCAIPRGPDRFRAYLRVMQTPDRTDMALPLANFNPMAREHVGELIETLLRRDFENVVAEAIHDVNQRLRHSAPRVRLGVVLADDARGGWTHRAMTDFKHRFDNRGELRRDFATVLLWTSEAVTAADLRQRVLLTGYRAARWLRVQPEKLSEMLCQEGLAARFAGVASRLSDADAEALRTIIEPHAESTDYSVLLPCLYGDAAATEVGHDPLGLPVDAGFELALYEVQHAKIDPVQRLADLAD